MIVITAERCDHAIEAARKNGRRLEKEVKNVQAAQAFRCTRQGRKITPAECHDCFNTLGPSLRLATNDNRQRCIEINKPSKGKIMNKENPKPKSPLPPAKIEGEVEPKIKPGQIIKVVLEKGQEPVAIKITREMEKDREAALKYAERAARDKSLAEIQLCVAAALYLGSDDSNPLHAPWVIDGHESREDAAKEIFGWSKAVASYRRRLGVVFILQYGKENVLQKASELGISKIPYHKLREFLKAPKRFERFLNTGHFEAADGKVITVDDVLKNPVGQLPLLFESFTEPKPERELPSTASCKSTSAAANALGMTETAPKALLSAKETEERIHNTLASIYENLRTACITMQKESEIWPANALAVINASEPLQKTIESIRDLAARLLSALYAAETEPDKIPEIIGYMVEDSELHQLAEFRLKLSLPGWCRYHNLPETAVQEIAKAQGVGTTDSLDSRTFARFYSEWKKNKGS